MNILPSRPVAVNLKNGFTAVLPQFHPGATIIMVKLATNSIVGDPEEDAYSRQARLDVGKRMWVDSVAGVTNQHTAEIVCAAWFGRPEVPVNTPHDTLAQEAADWDTGKLTPAGFKDAPEAIPNPPACPYCSAPWDKQTLCIDDRSLRFMTAAKGRIFVQITTLGVGRLICTACNCAWDQPSNVVIGD